MQGGGPVSGLHTAKSWGVLTVGKDPLTELLGDARFSTSLIELENK